MMWLIYSAIFLLMLLQVFRMLQQRGKWAWCLFLGLVGSAAAYVGLFFVPVLAAPVLQGHHAMLAVILIAGTSLYVACLVRFIRRMNARLRIPTKEP